MRFFLACILILSVACTENYFDEFAKKDTKEALFFDAKLKIDRGDFTGAIANFDFLFANHLGFYNDQNMVPLHASGYSGRCGLNLVALLDRMQNATGTILNTLMTGLPGATADVHWRDCLASEDLLEAQIGDFSARNGDENLFMAFNSMAKIGTILSSRADTAAPLGTFDPGFNACSDSAMPEAEVREIGSGIALVLRSLAGLGSSFVDTAEIDTLCLNPALVAACNKVDPTTFTGPEVIALRHAIGSSDFGIASCGNTFTNCVVNPCPVP